MTNNFWYTVLFVCFIFSASNAQQSTHFTSDYLDFQKALTLYNSKQYLAAQSLFDQIEDNTNDGAVKSDCAFYIANCAVRLNQQNADDLVLNFVEDYPTSTKRNTAFIDVADYYFENNKFAYSQKWYDKVDEESLARGERDKYNFNYGYSLYKTGTNTSAKKYLSRVENSSEYGSQAKYYLGFMAYEGDDYDEASEFFEKVEDEEKYQEKLSYYQADLNFKLGNFQKAITLSEAQMPNASETEKSELSKIIGESYFNLEKYSEAIDYLKDYKGKRGRWSNTDFYQLGYAYYKQNDFTNAVAEFNKIIDGNDAVAQNAYYHLGESYLKLDKTSEALNAFRNAAYMDYDLKIQEDAWYNYAKISYDVGNPYETVPQVLSKYLNKYPDTAYKEEVEGLLIDSYISSKNYKEAFDLLEGKKGYDYKLAYQKVAFYRGIELYNDSDYKNAENYFDASLKESLDQEFTARATYWKSECDYNLSNFDEALIGFKQFAGFSNNNLSESLNLNYNIAYTYFKLKNYAKAQSSFDSYINSSGVDNVRKNDAYLRLGDSYFVSSQFNQAINAYDNALNIGEIENDYASFQKVMSQGYLGKVNDKISGLNAFVTNYENSGLRDDALYELGNTYVKIGNSTEAISKYNMLVREYKKSPFVSKAVLRKGLVYYNDGANEDALDAYKKVARDFPGTPEAMQAVSSARLVYVDLGRVDEYASWARTLDYIDVTNADLDDTAYEAAEKKYLVNNSNEAIRQFNKYLSDFPNGRHTLNAHFYIAQLYYQQDLPSNATTHYEYVVNQSSGEFTETSLTRLGEIYLNNKNYGSAIPILQRLENEASFPQNRRYAQSNLMKAFYQEKQYTEAVTYAESVLQSNKIDKSIKSDAYVIIARSAIITNDESKAKEAYAKVLENADGELAAEALYYDAYFKNNEGSYEASNTIIKKLAKDYSSYRYYAAKGLVVMAKNYEALDDSYQAIYILENVIENFNAYDDVVDEAKENLSSMRSEASKTNSSIINEN